MDQPDMPGEQVPSDAGVGDVVSGEPTRVPEQGRPWWRSPLAAVAAALLVMSALVLVINLASGSSGDSDTEVSAEAEEFEEDPAPESTEPARSDCELMAEAIFNDMDAGYSATDIFSSYGGVEDPDTQHFVQVYYQWRSWAIQMGRDDALLRVFDDVNAWCSGGAIGAPTDDDYDG